MNDKALTMKNEIRQIAKYRGLILSKYYLCIILTAATVYLGIYRFPASSLYVVLFLIVLPPIITSLLKDYSQKHQNRFLKHAIKEEAYLLSNLKKKYNYSGLRYIANQCAYLICMLLICLWQINFSRLEPAGSFVEKLPFAALISGLTLRYLAVIIYRIKLPYDLMHNKV